jgi:hypothetical protein
MKTPSHSANHSARRNRPTLEVLEDRRLLSGMPSLLPSLLPIKSPVSVNLEPLLQDSSSLTSSLTSFPLQGSNHHLGSNDLTSSLFQVSNSVVTEALTATSNLAVSMVNAGASAVGNLLEGVSLVTTPVDNDVSSLIATPVVGRTTSGNDMDTVAENTGIASENASEIEAMVAAPDKESSVKAVLSSTSSVLNSQPIENSQPIGVKNVISQEASVSVARQAKPASATASPSYSSTGQIPERYFVDAPIIPEMDSYRPTQTSPVKADVVYETNSTPASASEVKSLKMLGTDLDQSSFDGVWRTESIERRYWADPIDSANDYSGLSADFQPDSPSLFTSEGKLSALAAGEQTGLDSAIRNFFNDLDAMSNELTGALTGMHMPVWLLVAGGFAMVAEITRRRAIHPRAGSALLSGESLTMSDWYPTLLGMSGAD